MLTEINGDLFAHTTGRVPVHCIASDHAMGAGIAVPMAGKYGLRKPMDELGMLPWPSCLYINGVLNMVTKRWSSGKTALRVGGNFEQGRPTYESFRKALGHCAEVCRLNNITKVVMPRIGCGLDGLDWNIVRRMISETMKDIDVLVCTL